jgi:hypothetical protein
VLGLKMTARRPCSPAPGPLEEYVARFDDLFVSFARRRGFREYLTGLLAGHRPDRKMLHVRHCDLLHDSRYLRGPYGEGLASLPAGQRFSTVDHHYLMRSLLVAALVCRVRQGPLPGVAGGSRPRRRHPVHP